MTGKLTLVSLGPGDLDYLPAVARRALEEAEAVVGYTFYINLIRPLLQTGQSIIESQLGSELDRAEQAITLAAAGQRVAVVSSGDIGIYAMAGPIYEVLRASGWEPGGVPEVQVIPGISALQAAAARLGAPIAHDFCTISLSDLHTNWAVISRRIDAAGRGDFVIAFFNPRSRERDWQLAEARRILLLHRSPDTPAALVRNVSRPDEQIRLTTLGGLADCLPEVDMFTLVFVGSSQTTFVGEQWLTPRYAKVEMNSTNLAMADPGADYPITLAGLRGTPVVVVGGGRIGERKISGLLNAGASIRLISPEITPGLQAHVAASALEWIARPYRRGDAAGARLAFAATNDRAVNGAVAQECQAAGILVNVADAPAECDFILPAVARRDGLTIAVNTAERDPRRAKRVRDALREMDLPS